MLEHNTIGLSIFQSAARLTVVGALLAAAACTFKAEDLKSVPSNLTSGSIAAGSSTSLQMATFDTIDHATSSNPDVLTVTGQGFDSVSVTSSGKLGSATITAYDAANNVLGANTAQIVPTTVIALDEGVSSGLTVLVGQPYGVHATTIGADGGTLVGDGAIHFAYQGGLTTSADSDACFWGGDCGGFEFAAPGDGQVIMTATSTSATTTLALHAVASVDTFTLSQSSIDLPRFQADAGSETSTVSYAISTAGKPVSALPSCVVADNDMVMAMPPMGSELRAPGGTIGLAGFAAGSTTVTCTVGGQTATLTVNVK